jgi:hypothetical protein
MTARGGQEGRNFGPIQLVADCVGVDLPSEKAAGFLAGPASAENIRRRDGVSKLATFVCSPPPSRNFAISWRCLNQKSSQFLIRRNVLFSPGCRQVALFAICAESVGRRRRTTSSGTNPKLSLKLSVILSKNLTLVCYFQDIKLNGFQRNWKSVQYDGILAVNWCRPSFQWIRSGNCLQCVR